MTQTSTSVQQITEVVALMPRALTLWVASCVPVDLDTPEMDSHAQVNSVLIHGSHQQTGTCLPAEPADSYCICAWSGLKPLGQQQRPCKAVNQTQTW